MTIINVLERTECNICFTETAKFIKLNCACINKHMCVNCAKNMYLQSNSRCPFCHTADALIKNTDEFVC